MKLRLQVPRLHFKSHVNDPLGRLLRAQQRQRVHRAAAVLVLASNYIMSTIFVEVGL